MTAMNKKNFLRRRKMKRTICDRCKDSIDGAVSIIGIWGEDGIRGSGLPTMNGIPAVKILRLCEVCRTEIEDVITHGLPM